MVGRPPRGDQPLCGGIRCHPGRSGGIVGGERQETVTPEARRAAWARALRRGSRLGVSGVSEVRWILREAAGESLPPSNALTGQAPALGPRAGGEWSFHSIADQFSENSHFRDGVAPMTLS